jgi:antitoxin component of MazEF toxin-antitoxin module
VSVEGLKVSVEGKGVSVEGLTHTETLDYNIIIMTQKIIKIGSSAGVTIPKKQLEDLGIKIGDVIDIAIKPVAKTKADREVIEWTDTFIKKYRSALEALAKK